MRVDILGVQIDNVTMAEALETGVRLMEMERPAICVTPNAEIVYEALGDEALAEVLGAADLVLPDGAGVVLASKILGTPLKEKVAGIEFAEGLVKTLSGTERTFYFLGGKPGVAETAAEKLSEKYPGLQVCGTHDGYFQEEGPIIEEINSLGPDVVFVCLGAGKQEQFMYRNRDKLRVGLMIGLGGSLDGFAGNVKRAPKWMIKCNLEWLYRLCKEPRRLGRMMRLPKFLLKVVLRRMKG